MRSERAPIAPHKAVGVVRTRVVRRIAADPTSAALLLAGPAALELWPGVRHVGAAGDRALVEAELPGGGNGSTTTAAAVRARPPLRTATSYLTRFGWSGPGLPATDGSLTLSYAPCPAGSVATYATLVLYSTDLVGSRLDELRLRRMAVAFLANLAWAAESRSRAA